MTHYSVLVITREENIEDVMLNPEAHVAEALEPFDETLGGGWNSQGKWDWYSVGGRWTGAFGDYDPEKDPANSEPCEYCEQTGKRVLPIDPEAGEVTCNVCDGTGTALKWPTEWVKHNGDVIKVSDIPIEFGTAATLTPDGEWHDHSAGYFPSDEETEAASGLFQQVVADWPDHIAVLVDCHS